jgi:hypothetical protein
VDLITGIFLQGCKKSRGFSDEKGAFSGGKKKVKELTEDDHKVALKWEDIGDQCGVWEERDLPCMNDGIESFVLR